MSKRRVPGCLADASVAVDGKLKIVELSLGNESETRTSIVDPRVSLEHIAGRLERLDHKHDSDPAHETRRSEKQLLAARSRPRPAFPECAPGPSVGCLPGNAVARETTSEAVKAAANTHV